MLYLAMPLVKDVREYVQEWLTAHPQPDAFHISETVNDPLDVRPDVRAGPNVKDQWYALDEESQAELVAQIEAKLSPVTLESLWESTVNVDRRIAFAETL